MNFADLKLNTRFRINAPGWKKTEIWVVEKVSAEYIGVVDQREIVPGRNISTMHLHADVIERYAGQGQIEALEPFTGDTYLRNGLASANPDWVPESRAIPQRAAAANIERVEANLDLIEVGQPIPYDIGEWIRTGAEQEATNV